MTPGLLLVSLGGHVLIVAGYVWLLYRLGGFTPTVQERRSWTILPVLAVAWVLLLAFIGPLPLPLVLAADLGVLLYFVWAWRTGRFRLDRVPVDIREETSRRRVWMREHFGLMVALGIGTMFATIGWALVAALILP